MKKLKTMKRITIYLFLACILISCSDPNCISGDCINGYGGYAWDNGDKYQGNWEEGKMHAKGTFLYDDGWGEFKEEYKTLKSDFRDGKLEWGGLGDRYVGEFKDGMKHGEGTYDYGSYSQNDRYSYRGEWKDSYRVSACSFLKWHSLLLYNRKDVILF